ncbi:MAG: PAS domain-containing sensor histidine kinase [Actinomycetota bacterium]
MGEGPERPTAASPQWFFFDHAFEGMLVCSARDGVVVAANDAWLELTGYELAEVVGRTWAELAFTGEPHEVRLRTAAADDRIVERRSRPIEIDGEPYVLITATDLTEGRRLLIDLERSRSDLARAQAMTRVGSFTFDVRTNEVLASDEFLRLFATNAADFQGTLDDVLRRLHPEDIPLVLEGVRAIVEDHVVPTTRVRLLPADGRTRWLEGQGEIEFDPAGNPVRVFGTAQDVTERIALEQEGRRLFARVVELREADRREIAEEVQDGLLQTLAALLLRIESLTEGGDQRARRDLDQVAEAVRGSMERLRRLVFDLRPSALDHGIGAAVEELASRMLAAWDLDVDVQDATSDTLSDELRATVYRFLREALAALAPGTAAVRIAVEDDLLVEVRHRGPGRLGEGDRPLLEEAAQLAGGTLEVEADGETFLLLRLPNPTALPVEP